MDSTSVRAFASALGCLVVGFAMVSHDAPMAAQAKGSATSFDGGRAYLPIWNSVVLQQRPTEREGVVVPGGGSPDGRFEVRLIQDTAGAPSSYAVAIVDNVTRRVVKEVVPSGGYFSYAEARKDAEERGSGRIVRALWHPGSGVVALTDAGSAHSRELYIYEVSDGGATRMEMPDYRQNALGRVDATALADTAFVELRAWDGDVLHCLFTFRVRRAGAAPVEQYSVPFSLRLMQGPTVRGGVGLDGMEKPTLLACC